MMEALTAILDKLDHLEKCLNNIYSKFLTVDEASIYCRISESKMRKLIRSGKMPIHKIDGKILLNRRELDYLIMTGTSRPTKRDRERVQCLL